MIHLAQDESIAGHTRRTNAIRNVVGDLAYGILATMGGRARVDAFVARTCFVAWTFFVCNAFGTTSYIRIAEVLRQTRAHTIMTLSVWTARRWVTRVDWNRLLSWNTTKIQ